MSNAEDIRKFAKEHPNQIHPDFATIVHTLELLEEIDTLVADKELSNNPDLNKLLKDASSSLNKAQQDLKNAAVLSEPISYDGTDAGDIK